MVDSSRSLILSLGAVFIILLRGGLILAESAAGDVRFETSPKPRVVVLTDITNEPDDEESMVRFLVYCNEYDVEGLIATTSVWLKDKVRPDKIRERVDAYGQVRDNLLKHASRYPSADRLRGAIKSGLPEFGMKGVGPGKESEGSRHIIEVVDRPDERPVWISVWGGVNCLAQALWDVKNTRSQPEIDAFVARLRVYTISDQDDAGRWIRATFPELSYIVTPSSVDWRQYYHATWTGISGDRHYQNGPMHKFELVDNPWLEENIIKDHGPLGALYPKLEYIMEGDTPSFLGLIDNGLGWAVSPAYGGWGGRYVLYECYGETRPIWTNVNDARDTVTADNGVTCTSAQATIWRWREAYQHDFAARMDWCVADSFEKANHNPVAVLAGDRSKGVAHRAVQAGQPVVLDASGSHDPDGGMLSFRWFVYKEAGSYRGNVEIQKDGSIVAQLIAPQVSQPQTIHVIIEVKDSGRPALFAYRRMVLTVQP